MVMGANVGTSVTNTLVALLQLNEEDGKFEKAFSCAVVHDIFNWLTALTLLVIELFTGYLYVSQMPLLFTFISANFCVKFSQPFDFIYISKDQF